MILIIMFYWNINHDNDHCHLCTNLWAILLNYCEGEYLGACNQRGQITVYGSLCHRANCVFAARHTCRFLHTSGQLSHCKHIIKRFVNGFRKGTVSCQTTWWCLSVFMKRAFSLLGQQILPDFRTVNIRACQMFIPLKTRLPTVKIRNAGPLYHLSLWTIGWRQQCIYIKQKKKLCSLLNHICPWQMQTF